MRSYRKGFLINLKCIQSIRYTQWLHLRTAISLLGLYDDEADIMEPEANYRKAIRLQAKLPTIVAAFSRIRKGLEPVGPKRRFKFCS